MKFNVPVNCILARDLNNGIAKNEIIPWHITEDLVNFKNITTCNDKNKKNIIIMGKNTWDNIPLKFKPFIQRINIIISTTTEEQNLDIVDRHYDPLIFCNNIQRANEYINKRHKLKNDIGCVFICGGKQLYDYFLNSYIVDNIYLTTINYNYSTDLIVNFNQTNYELIDLISKNCHDDVNNINVNLNYSVYCRKKNIEEIQYLNILQNIITKGDYRQTRNANTYSIFGDSMSFDLSQSFPLFTSKKMFFKGIFEELKFFLLGQTNTKILEEKKVNIWKDNTSREFLDSVGLVTLNEGDMGPLYGFQLRHYGSQYTGCDSDYTGFGFDQIKNVIHLLKTDKFSRRIMMTTYNPIQLKECPLPPCHGIVIQFGIEGKNKLCCHTYQRSADFFHGIPFNVASYALLVHIITELINNDETYTGEKFEVGKLTIALGDCHIYESHLELVKEQITRRPYLFPNIKINKKINNIDNLKDLFFEDIEIINYSHHNSLKANMVA
jgi:thymidylate synthase